MKTLALFGGTFDPVHQGHIQSAIELKSKLALDELRLLPCHLPPHRGQPGCSSAQRLAMVRLACQNTSLGVDERELARSGPSYTVDTLTELRAESGRGVSLVWVMGTDAFNKLDSWHRWQALLDLAHIVVMARPGESLIDYGPVAQLLQAHHSSDHGVLKRVTQGAIVTVALTPYPVSATEIREKLKKRQSVDGLLAANVVDYIKTKNLYR